MGQSDDRSFAGHWNLRVTRKELDILRSAITRVARHDPFAWNRLKWETWEYGNRDHYSAEELFYVAAESTIDSLPGNDKEALCRLWRDSHPARAQDEDHAILNAYAGIIVEKIVERARSAAYRTINW